MIRESYRGYEILIRQEVFWYIDRESNDASMAAGVSDEDDASITDKFVKVLKERIDSELEREHPWSE